MYQVLFVLGRNVTQSITDTFEYDSIVSLIISLSPLDFSAVAAGEWGGDGGTGEHWGQPAPGEPLSRSGSPRWGDRQVQQVSYIQPGQDFFLPYTDRTEGDHHCQLQQKDQSNRSKHWGERSWRRNPKLSVVYVYYSIICARSGVARLTIWIFKYIRNHLKSQILYIVKTTDILGCDDTSFNACQNADFPAHRYWLVITTLWHSLELMGQTTPIFLLGLHLDLDLC